uniref:Carboxylesterase type B domain-containing protein n=1 Tax=Tetranychus urticae TaxID=32264 RepID=T1KIY2_TETUR
MNPNHLVVQSKRSSWLNREKAMIKCFIFNCIHFYRQSSFTFTNVEHVRARILSLLIVFTLFNPLCQGVSGSTMKQSSDRRYSSRIVSTKYGTLRGFIVNLSGKINLQPVEVFLGVPYASPPVGKLRFMPPVTPAHWNGAKSAHSQGPVCPQNLPNISNTSEALKTMSTGRLRTLKRLIPLLLNQSEDCLYLNIFTPYSASNEMTKLPVIVFIHGESYEWNSGSSYDGSVLSSFGNVVVVTINYRLGVLGFFPALDGSSRGNFGLMDQVAALHWVQENIAGFGGDPTNVTVFGHGQGAACINILMVSPMAKGLFHRAILHSGTGLSPWAMATDAVDYSRKLAALVGCPDGDDQSSQMIDCLRSKDYRDLISPNLPVPSHLTSLGPTVDGIVIPDHPEKLMNSAQYSHLFGSIDLLLGITSKEYFKFNGNEESSGIDLVKEEKIVRTLVRNLFNYHLQEIFHTIVNEYTDWTKHEVSLKDILKTTSDIVSDGTVISQAIKVAQLHSNKSGDYPSSEGCVHGEELAYIFGSPLVSQLELGYFVSDYTPEETALSARIITYWTNFAKTGQVVENIGQQFNDDPNDDGYKSSNGIKEMIFWPRYDEYRQQYLSINLEPSVKDHYRAHQLSVWLNLIPKIHLPGPGPLTYQHHLLTDYDDLSTYEGIVRSTASLTHAMVAGLVGSESTLDSSLQQNAILGSIDSLHQTSSWPGSSQIDGPNPGLMATSPVSVINSKVNSLSSNLSISQQQQFTDKNKSLSSQPQQSLKEMKQIKDASSSSSSHSSWEDSFHFKWNGPYSTTLSVTIAIGCTFLILNGLMLAAFFYKRGRPNQTQSVNDSSASKDKTRAIQSHPSSNLTNESAKKQGRPHQSHQQQQSHQQSVQSSLPDSPFKLSSANTGLLINSPVGLIEVTNEMMGRTASPSIKAEAYPVDYISSVTGSQMMALNGDLTSDLLENISSTTTTTTATGDHHNDSGGHRLINTGGGGNGGGSHVSMCNSVFYPDKCPTISRLSSHHSPAYRTISQNKFGHIEEPREFHEMNI